MNENGGRSEITSLLGDTGLFRDIPLANLEKIARKFKREIRHKGATVYKKGDPGDRLYLIESGQVALMGTASDGKEVVLTVLSRGEVFG